MNGNGHELPTTGNPLVDAALKRLGGQFADLGDAMIVQGHLEKRQSEMLAKHAQFIERDETTMREIDEKLNALTMWLIRKEGLPEAGEGLAPRQPRATIWLYRRKVPL
jgi:hypothetical protein